MRIFTLVLALVCSLPLFARDLRGRVVDENGSPVSFVNVVLLRDSVFSAGTVTDDAGAFSFTKISPDADKVKISMMGYDDVILPLAEKEDLGSISLQPSAHTLGEVTVTGNLPTTRIKGDAMVTRVENTLLSTTGSANDVLKNIPMVAGSDGSFSVFGSGNAAIYVNGRLVRNSLDLAQLSSDNIREVQVINNPGSRYGADVKAVIRIVTKKPAGEGFSVSAFTDNTYNRWLSTADQLDLKYRTGGLEVFATGYYGWAKDKAAEYVMTDTYAKTLQHMTSDEAVTTYKWNMIGKVGFNYALGGNHSFGAYYRQQYKHDRTYGHYFNDITENGALAESSESNLRGKGKQSPNHQANVYYTGAAGKFTFDFNGDYMQTHDNDDAWQTERNTVLTDRTVSTYNVTRNRLLAEKASVSYELPHGSVQVGEEYTGSRSRDDFRNPEDILDSERTEVKERNMGVFADIAQSFGNFSANAGVRYEHVVSDYYVDGERIGEQSRTYDNWFPSAGVSYAPADYRLSFSYSNHTERPSYNSLSGNYFYANSFTYTRGNPSLRPAKLQDFSLLAAWRFLTFSATYSYNRDVIARAFEPYKGDERITVYTYANMKRQQLMSLYLNAAPDFGFYHPSLSLGMQKQWFNVPYRDGSMSFNRPLYTIRLRNTFTLPHDWRIDSWVWWQSRGDSMNTRFTRTQSTVDIRFTKMFLNRALAVYLDFNNIFNGSNVHAMQAADNVRMHMDMANHTRSVELTIRYTLNTSRSRYQGTGAGEAEKSRF